MYKLLSSEDKMQVKLRTGGINCFVCGLGIKTILGLISIGLGIAGMISNQVQIVQGAIS
ncbi:hypothetical protein [Okeania sp. SIO2B3]|uniref:hypothetical protein n=1 Tax=Okeania sp. SIO2B3 TaxID=2607784 RepID=UPI0013C29207|nr:hypothetical protein [Okeania sp. SIO2B3]NET47063.1 hypothetical protein [Okeania sp. SIO2B3]